MSMFIQSQAADPEVHALCVKIATRCVWVIQPILREGDRDAARTEFYRICREEINKPPRRPEVRHGNED